MGEKFAECEFTVWDEPRGKGRPRFSKRGTVYTDSTTKNAERCMRQAYQAASTGEAWDGEVHVTVYSQRRVPKSLAKRDDGKPDLSRPDADNIGKLVMDALNGVAFIDDRQVTMLKVVKMPLVLGSVPHVTVKLEFYGKQGDNDERSGRGRDERACCQAGDNRAG